MLGTSSTDSQETLVMRMWISLAAAAALMAGWPMTGTVAGAPLQPTDLQAQAGAPAPQTPAQPAQGEGRGRRGGRGGRGRGAQTPPPILTCTSPAAPTDNTVPAALAQSGFVSLFNGRDLSGWQALIDIGTLRSGAGLNPADLLKLSPAERAAKQAESNVKYLPHWTVVDGVLRYDGKGQNLQTVKEYGDIELYVDWCLEAGADTGVYLRNAPQIQVWDNPLGSGGLYNNQQGPRNPLQVADRPIDRWNTFHIIQRGDLTTIWLNGTLIVDHVRMENYWNRSQPLPSRGHIELQHHASPLFWKNIYVKELN
jgi:hypothetical protein